MVCTLSFPNFLTSFKRQAFPFPLPVLYTAFFPLCKSSHLFEIIIFPPFCLTKKKRKRRCLSRQTKGLFHRLRLNRSRPDIVKNTTLAVHLQHRSLNLPEFKMSACQYTLNYITRYGKAISCSIGLMIAFCT